VLINESGPSTDGALAWALRRFRHKEYVNELPPATTAPILITPASVTKPQVAAQYVGQDFVTYRTWDRGSLGLDFLAWLYDRQAQAPIQGEGRVIVWVRSDVYGVPTGGVQDPTNAPVEKLPGQ
jgi:hypothetical protein